jgi:hypothetical protein
MIRIRRIHLDYAGAEGLPKPMTLALGVEEGLGKADYELRAREIFDTQFPEWKLRGCQAADEDVEVEESTLHAVPDHDLAWLCR